MNTKMKYACAALCAALALCGCDRGTQRGLVPGLATSPREPVGAIATAGFEKAALDRLLDSLDADVKNALCEKFKAKTPEDLKARLKEAGLEDAQIEWAAVSILDLDVNDNDLPAAFAVLAVQHDFDKLVDAQINTANESARKKLRKGELLGEKALIIENRRKGAAAALVSLGGKLLVAGTTLGAAEQAIALYRDGAGGRPFPMTGETILRVHGRNIGKRLFEKMETDDIRDIFDDGNFKEPEKVVRALKDAEAELAMPAAGELAIIIATTAASKADADALAGTVKKALDQLKGQAAIAARFDPAAKTIAEAVAAISISSSGERAVLKTTLTQEKIKDFIK